MKRFIALTVLSALLLSFTACAGGIKSENLTREIEPSKTNYGADHSSGEYITDLGAGLLSLCYEGENVLISPLSVMCALTMVQNGADGNTKAEMEKVLGADTETLTGYVSSYCRSLPSGEKYKMSVANSVWLKNTEGLSVRPEFLQTVTDRFGADVFKSDFDRRTVKDINGWVNESTNEMIPVIIDDIPDNTVMYLINALAFEAEWAEIYEKHQVREDTFYLENGKTKTVDFMYSEEGVYLEDESTTGFIKYYSERKYAFAALLPKEGTSLADYIGTLTGKRISSLIDGGTKFKVSAAIPKFETEYSKELSDILAQMGMKDAFSPADADFSALGSYENGSLYINSVVHKTYICVAEKGTKAGAVTSIAVDAAGAPMIENEPKKVYLDRPFVYMLIDCETGTPFFIGAVTDPE